MTAVLVWVGLLALAVVCLRLSRALDTWHDKKNHDRPEENR